MVCAKYRAKLGSPGTLGPHCAAEHTEPPQRAIPALAYLAHGPRRQDSNPGLLSPDKGPCSQGMPHQHSLIPETTGKVLYPSALKQIHLRLTCSAGSVGRRPAAGLLDQGDDPRAGAYESRTCGKAWLPGCPFPSFLATSAPMPSGWPQMGALHISSGDLLHAVLGGSFICLVLTLCQHRRAPSSYQIPIQ